MNFSALILAGGHSSCMGRDKAFLRDGKKTWLERQTDVVREAGAAEVLVSGRRGADYSSVRARVLYDQFPNSGPLAGIHAGLSAMVYPRLLVLAVDLPAINSSLVSRLGSEVFGPMGVVPKVAGQIQPLIAFYPRAARDIAAGRLARGRLNARDFAETCVNSGLAVFKEFSATAQPLFRNCNEPSDLLCPIGSC